MIYIIFFVLIFVFILILNYSIFWKNFVSCPVQPDNPMQKVFPGKYQLYSVIAAVTVQCCWTSVKSWTAAPSSQLFWSNPFKCALSASPLFRTQHQAINNITSLKRKQEPKWIKMQQKEADNNVKPICKAILNPGNKWTPLTRVSRKLTHAHEKQCCSCPCISSLIREIERFLTSYQN